MDGWMDGWIKNNKITIIIANSYILSFFSSVLEIQVVPFFLVMSFEDCLPTNPSSSFL